MELQEEATSPLPQYDEIFNSNATALSLEELQELHMSSDCSDVSGRAFVLSYAPPDVVRQAKLEAMGLKVRRKMLEHKVSLKDPYALTCGHHEAAAPVGGIKVSAKTSGVGSSRELVQSLVVPPELTEHGEEVSGSSEFILAGQRREYQRPGPAQVRAPRGPTPSYRMYDPAERAAAAAAAGKGRGAAGGAVNGGAGGKDKEQGKEQAAGGSRRRMSSGAGAGGLAGKAKRAQSELKAQLSDGMLTYVPSHFERPKGVESTAFVPQVQAIMEARSKYESVKQRRPSSAPPRRSTSMAAAAPAAGSEVQGRSGVGAPDALDGGSRMLADRAPDGGAGGAREGEGYYPSSAAASAVKGWWQKVPVVRVQEIDLLATYRQNSQHLLAQPAKDTAIPESQLPRSTSSIIRATIQTTGVSPSSSAVDKRPGSARGSPAGPSSAVVNGSARRGVAGASSLPGSRRQLMPAAELHAQAAPEGASSPEVQQHRADRGTGSGSGQGPQSPLCREVTFSGATSASDPKAAWGAQAALTTAHSHVSPSLSSGDPKPVPTSPSCPRQESAAAPAPGGQQPWSARTSSAASSSAVGRSPRPPSPGPARPGRSASQRRASAPAGAPSAASIAASAPAGPTAAPIGSPASSGSGGGGHRVGFILQPVNPETRQMLRQQQCGGAIGAAKANRVRWPARSVGGGSAVHGGGSSSENGGLPGQPAWITSSSTLGNGPVDRLQLQERILDGLVRQYTLGQEERLPPPPAATPSCGGGGGVTATHTRGSSRPGAIDASVVSGGVSGGGGTITVQRNMHAVADHGHGHHHAPQQHQPQKATRPQSAPNRRVRPPSAGSWAGRPDPEALRSALFSHGSTGVVYDPELHPSPLDTYMNQLVGLD